MKKISVVLFIVVSLFGFDFQKEYQQQNFTRICKYGYHHLKEIKNNEDILSLVGFSCVKRDYFIYLPYIINYLKKTKKARENSIYFSLLFIEKKLLISYVLDGMDISYYRFPLIKHPLSVVMTHLINKDFKKDNDTIIIVDNNKTYKIYKNNQNKVFIDIYENNQLKETHWYR